MAEAAAETAAETAADTTEADVTMEAAPAEKAEGTEAAADAAGDAAADADEADYGDDAEGADLKAEPAEDAAPEPPPKPAKVFDMEWSATVPDDSRPKMKWSTSMNAAEADIGLHIDGTLLTPHAREGLQYLLFGGRATT